MRAVAAATDKRFRRAHVKPARKGALSIRRIWAALRVVGTMALVDCGGLVGDHGSSSPHPRCRWAT